MTQAIKVLGSMQCVAVHSGEHASGHGGPESGPGGHMFVVAWMVFGRHALHGPEAVLQVLIIAIRKFPYYS